ncbi:methyltransferase family protein [Amphiplicatus metriothermophilus]|uniref:Protein-S-isoprenylcysteine O-methyltransferase Ste14 n=1 Tax=Amphiplicatus metriothermophilus TaxID=1519374 RepID=A0A239PXY8_9PROT|nr:isoprenylcysteine carboxylmethyltransferase family protein [Amphiplicatus metriothermophilus]MBB5519921.1 protein-S-isoprenylcysteine O-methyltransferase Ste14 [Amphiplicatus metriothermophilus]SNT74822.1 Protein-S-isoprenylcysteine O-methyltransferase Ste14 [Amphiplicatus metriothermophilus]
MSETPQTAGVIASPPLMLLGALIAGFMLSNAAPLGVLAQIPERPRLIVGGLICLFCLVFSALAVMRFARKGTPVNPFLPPQALVADGVYGLVRNPMYVDFYGFSLGLAIVFAADWVIVATAVLAVVMHYFVIRREERFLEAKFGEPYRAYCARVKRYGLF